MKKFNLSFVILVICFVGFSTAVFSDQIAFTQDGRQVLLKDDGTWEYVKKEQEGKEKFHFRKTRWGMSSKLVKANQQTQQGELFIDKNDMIAYKDHKLNNLDCGVAYYFVKDQLASARYIFVEEHTNENDYINDFWDMKNLLIKKYGEVKSENIFWDNDLFQDDRSQWGTAVSIGHVSYMCNWETDETKIAMQLTGENYKINHIIYYTSKILGKSLVETEEKEVLDDL